MAGEDGQARFNTAAWGPDNRVLHGQWVVLQAAATHAVAVRQWLDESLRKVAMPHARALQKFKARLAEARTALSAAGQAADRRDALAERLAGLGLNLPTSAWPVLAFLALLGAGDLTMTSVAMMVLNISDRPYVSWLPFSALQVAAVPVVFGLLAAAHFLGESIKAYRCEERLRPVNLIIGAASLGGGLSLAVSVADIRNSYLAANGVPAMFWAFFGIQLGFFAVALAASTWAAHPYRAQWRQAARELRREVRRYLKARRSAGRQAGQVNELAARHGSLVACGADGVAAASSDGARQGHLYLRGHQHGLPEPVTDQLYADSIPQPELAGPVRELQEYPNVPPGGILAPLESVTLDDLDGAWEKLLQRMHAVGTVWRTGEPPVQQIRSHSLNGAASAQPGRGQGATAKANGTSRPGAK
jgi:hypothetical protein